METINAIATDTARNLPSGWEMVQLEDVVDILDSQRVPINSKERETRVGKVPYYGATGQVGWIDDHLFDEELVLLGEDGAPFLDSMKPKAYVVRGKSWVNNHAHVLRAKNGIPNTYIKHYLDIFDYHGFVTGTTRLKLTQAAMRQIPIPVAPPEQQKLIVAEIEKQFSRLDEAVANLKRVKANLKRYKAAVLKTAVEGRLVKTEAELARREGRSYETGAQLLQRILETRHNQWKGKGKYKEPAAPDTAELTELPEGWVWVTVSQLLGEPIVNGLSVKESTIPTEVRALRLSAMSDQGIDYTDHRFLPTKPDQVTDIMIQEGDVFVSRGNGSLHLVGRSTVAQPPPFDVIFPDTMMRIRLAQPIRVTAWFQTIWSSAAVRRQIERRVKTTAGIYKIAQPELASITIPLPPIDEQLRIVAEVELRFSIIGEVEAQVETNLKRAERLRQSVLMKAFYGGLFPFDRK